MFTVKRTDSENPDFIDLVQHLDADLAERDGSEHAFYAQFNKIDKIKYVVLVYEKEKPVGCGAIKEYQPGVMEMQRVFWKPARSSPKPSHSIKRTGIRSSPITGNTRK